MNNHAKAKRSKGTYANAAGKAEKMKTTNKNQDQEQ